MPVRSIYSRPGDGTVGVNKGWTRRRNRPETTKHAWMHVFSIKKETKVLAKIVHIKRPTDLTIRNTSTLFTESGSTSAVMLLHESAAVLSSFFSPLGVPSRLTLTSTSTGKNTVLLKSSRPLLETPPPPPLLLLLVSRRVPLGVISHVAPIGLPVKRQ